MRRLLFPGLVALCLLRPGLALAQEPTPAGQDTARAGRDTILEDGISAGEADGEPRRRRLVKWNEYEGPFITFRFGAGFLVDYTSYLQDEASKEQFSLEPGYKLRDFRLIMGGRIKTKRRITYQAGLMYDAPTKSWFVRQTGFMVAVPELWGHFFIGRSKAGISENRVMVGYDGWGIERAPISETIPLLADGVKWLGYLPSRHLLWNLGWFTDLLSEGQSFSYFDNQVAAAWAGHRRPPRLGRHPGTVAGRLDRRVELVPYPADGRGPAGRHRRDESGTAAERRGKVIR